MAVARKRKCWRVGETAEVSNLAIRGAVVRLMHYRPDPQSRRGYELAQVMTRTGKKGWIRVRDLSPANCWRS